MGSKFNLHTRWGVFSPRSIDDGTLLLMTYISADESDVCLDLGCGYGPIGLALARQCHKGQVHMVDKDFVAVELANDNAKRNGITNAKAYLSDAFIHVPSEIKFNQVISNIPAKVGREQLSIILYDDYVIIHELVHTIHRNHSLDFWSSVESIMPDYKEHKLWLKTNGYKLRRV